MKQLIQHINTGLAQVQEVPAPRARSGGILVQNAASLVSAGTERMIVDFAEKNLLDKARSRPDLVRQTLDKAQREGVLTTLDAVRSKLDQPMALGYSCAGTVIEVGDGANKFQIGDRVACAGAGHASHAEIVSIPKNLAVKLPEEVGFEAAAFCTVGAIALQGIRLTDVKLGEVVAVIGLGLLGQLAVQMLKAAGCVVIGLDPQAERAQLALQMGADAAVSSREDLIAACLQRSAGHGADAVLIAADTKSNEPVETAGEACRKKGVVTAVGAVGMNIPRKIYYEKEIDFRISCSYGPGRYDAQYEEKGHDYPYAYVRWTEGRNMGAFAQLAGAGQINLDPIITHRFPIEDSPRAYELITGKTGEPFLGVLLTYPDAPDLSRRIALQPKAQSAPQNERASVPIARVGLGVLGAGGFANATILPAAEELPAIKFLGIASSGGLSARSAADQFGFDYCASDEKAILDDPNVDLVAVLTRHHLHARQVVAALEAGKHVFVEKPLCLSEAELQKIEKAYAARDDEPLLMVGFNRRFAPFVVELKKHLQKVREPLMMHYRVNAGYIPPDHWTQDISQGGGRLLGEGCHFIDLLIHLADSAPRRIITRALPDAGKYAADNLLITLEFADGSLGTITYLANGNKAFGKEMLEVSGGGLSARLDDYRSLTICGATERVKQNARLRQDKGHRAEWSALAGFLTRSSTRPITFEETVISTRATFAAWESLQSGEAVELEKKN